MPNILEDDISLECKTIVKCLIKGYSIKEIADILNYSKSSVSNKIKALFKKYNSSSRLEFICTVFASIIKEYKQKCEFQEKKISKLNNDISNLSSVLEEISDFSDFRRIFEFKKIVNKAKPYIKK